MNPVGHGPGRHIDLTADDGLNPGGFGRLVKVDDAVHDAVVCNGHSLLPQLLHPLHEPVDAAGPVQEAVLRMHMQMDKSHLFSLLWLRQLHNRRDRWLMEDLVMGGCISPASSVKLDSGFSCRALAAWSGFSGRDSSPAPFLQPTDGGQALLGGVHHLGGVGVVAVAPAVDLVFQFFLQLGLHNPHGGYRAPSSVRKSSMELLCLKYSTLLPLRFISLG